MVGIRIPFRDSDYNVYNADQLLEHMLTVFLNAEEAVRVPVRSSIRF